MGMFRLLRLFEPLPTRRLDGRFGFCATLTVVVTVTACCSSIASAWVRCLTVLCCSSGSAFTSTLGSVVVIGFTSRALSEETLLHTDLCASKMNSSWFFSSCSCWICSCKAFFLPSHRLTSSCRLSVWSTLLLRHRAAANLFLSLLLLRAEGLLLLISGFPPSTPVHFLLFLLAAWLQQLKAGGWGGARCHHCGHPTLLPVRRVHVDVRLVLQRWWCETCLVLVRLWFLHVHEHLLDCFQGCRRERVCRVGWLQCDVTAEVLFAHNLDPSCHLPSLRRSLLLPLTSLTHRS